MPYSLILFSPLVTLLLWPPPDERSPKGPTTQRPLEIRFEDLSKRSQERFKKIFEDAINSLGPEAREAVESFFKAGKITDPIERKLFDELDRFTGTNAEGVLYSIYVLMPGKNEGVTRFAELKDKSGKVVLRYKCTHLELNKPLALFFSARKGDGRSVEEKLLLYDSKSGWGPVNE
jgi:hypothetical protein